MSRPILADSDHAGPSRLPFEVAAMASSRRRRVSSRRKTILLADETQLDDDCDPRRAGTVDCSIDQDTDSTLLFGDAIVTGAVSHRYVPLSLRSMASEMVRPPEVSSAL